MSDSDSDSRVVGVRKKDKKRKKSSKGSKTKKEKKSKKRKKEHPEIKRPCNAFIHFTYVFVRFSGFHLFLCAAWQFARMMNTKTSLALLAPD